MLERVPTLLPEKGFTQLEDLGVLETDTDVMEMAKRMASQMQAEGRVLLGTVNQMLTDTYLVGARSPEAELALSGSTI
jgi:hypothetical protein